MKEAFLHYIWQQQAYEKAGLHTTDGQPLTVMDPGQPNRHQGGPDFWQAHLNISGLEWHGAVEIHAQAADWRAHGHHTDPAYNAVILHVVWEGNAHDGPRQDGTHPPMLVLKDRVPALLISRYERLASSEAAIPCRSQWDAVSEPAKQAALRQAGEARTYQRTVQLRSILNQYQQDWEQTTYHWLLRYLGAGANQEPFEQLAQRVPWKRLQQHADQPLQVEGLLFGMAGMLAEQATEPYLQALWREFRFLANKYGLARKMLRPTVWNWKGVRPAHFPSVRLAQLAALVGQQPNLLSAMLHADTLAEAQQIFAVPLSAYWQQHHRPGTVAARPVRGIGKAMQQRLVLNVLLPIWALQAQLRGRADLHQRAQEIMVQLPPEDNRWVRQWPDAQALLHASHSQAVLHQVRQLCQLRRCGQCAIGQHLLGRAL